MAEPVLIAGEWRDANASSTFQAVNPRTTEKIAGDYPVSTWQDLDAMLDAATDAYRAMRLLPAETLAAYLDLYASALSVKELAHSSPSGSWVAPPHMNFLEYELSKPASSELAVAGADVGADVAGVR